MSDWRKHPLAVPGLALVAGLLVALVVPASALAEDTETTPPLEVETILEAIDVDALGPQVGESIPDFELPDQHGERHPDRTRWRSRGGAPVEDHAGDGSVPRPGKGHEHHAQDPQRDVRPGDHVRLGRAGRGQSGGQGQSESSAAAGDEC